ncbi:fatty acyl-CoA reductase 1 [Thecamonas trahens ATCC 50062]|uniref:Fatty acyl-CoA reductase 1 n=1 Tax=Thecamonas trahens ATCC 50062 TaxID=461836 RepID=A0A0L0DI50_THETB|nr:fatty acyl-CoA reductase 1 [Thecamonas trahens ATCC 50062]KNC50978.1 fatty acyl-CoA reductase 1 [Thecamonas trahens ATCC 50062]|eukprot:XP_013756449.1 fatty acyl-CoA reductase 1 [Thecamonas trahens ATCC 50062]
MVRFVTEHYAGKGVLLTGATGFIGKVMLEKLLREVPDLASIDVLIRGRGASAPAAARLETEVRDSPAFDLLRALWPPPYGLDRELVAPARAGLVAPDVAAHLTATYPSFNAYFAAKVRPLAGDLTLDRLGLDDATVTRLLADVHVVLSVAASVAFDNPLPEAIALNIRGQLALFDIMMASNILVSFTHISTAYVGSNRDDGLVPEGVLPLPAGMVADPEVEYANLIATPPDELIARQATIIGKYPNTYTYTKALAERLLHARLLAAAAHRNVLLVTIRPTIVGAAYAEPFPGWVDAVSAGGALYLFAGVGVLQFGNGDASLIGDQIPVDYVSNFVLTAAPTLLATGAAVVPATGAGHPAQEFIFHSGSSALNPVTWKTTGEAVISYWNENAPDAGFRPAEFLFHSRLVADFRRLVSYATPAAIASLYAHIVPIKANTKAALQARGLSSQASFLISAFRRFMTHEWIFDMTHSDALLLAPLAAADTAQTWRVDVRDLHWPTFISQFAYGLHRFVLGEPVRLASPPAYRPHSVLDEAILSTRAGHALDTAAWAASAPLSISHAGDGVPVSASDVRHVVLASPRLRATLRSLASSKAHYRKLKAAARAELDRMAADMAPSAMRFAAWLLRLLCTRLYATVSFNSWGAEKVLGLVASSAADLGIVYVPSHRSYLDFILLSYLCFQLGLPVPHVAATGDFLSTPMISGLMRAAGAFFIRRSGKTSDPVYRAVLAEYMASVINHGAALEFFVEGTRSRTGKSLPPRLGLLTQLAQLQACGALNRSLVFVPVSIAFERLIEAPLYGRELDGQPKTPETFLGALAGVRAILNNDYGRVAVEFGEPLHLADALPLGAESCEDELRAGVAAFATRISHRLDAGMTLFPTHLLAASLLAAPGPVAVNDLVSATDALRAAVELRTGASLRRADMLPIVASGSITRAAKLLAPFVVSCETTARLAPADPQARLVLATYKNSLLRVFALDAVVALAMRGGLVRRALAARAVRLAAILGAELLLANHVPAPENLADEHWLDDYVATEFVGLVARLAVFSPLTLGYIDGSPGPLPSAEPLAALVAPSPLATAPWSEPRAAVMDRARALAALGDRYESRSTETLKAALAWLIKAGLVVPSIRKSGREALSLARGARDILEDTHALLADLTTARGGAAQLSKL